MTENPRAETFQVLIELSRRYPDWRIGQLIANVAGWAEADVWDVEDRQLLDTVKIHLQAAGETADHSEQALAADWSRPKEGMAWSQFQPPK